LVKSQHICKKKIIRNSVMRMLFVQKLPVTSNSHRLKKRQVNIIALIATFFNPLPHTRRKIRLIEGNAKCRRKKIDLQMDFAAGVYLSEAQNPIPLPPPHTQYTYSCREGGVRGLNQREG
jgi:hypothetical protein